MTMAKSMPFRVENSGSEEVKKTEEQYPGSLCKCKPTLCQNLVNFTYFLSSEIFSIEDF